MSKFSKDSCMIKVQTKSSVEYGGGNCMVHNPVPCY